MTMEQPATSLSCLWLSVNGWCLDDVRGNPEAKSRFPAPMPVARNDKSGRPAFSPPSHHKSAILHGQYPQDPRNPLLHFVFPGTPEALLSATFSAILRFSPQS
jgi:hypothetical protein